MSTVTTQWVAELVDNVSSPVEGITDAAGEAAEAIEGIEDAAKDAGKEIEKLSAMDLKSTADAIRDLTEQFDDLM
ncbi:MAG: hypothetical protein LBJ23_09525, partial [Tannerella sp.]|nr:hypothetical protein [Tannerella sp.]